MFFLLPKERALLLLGLGGLAWVRATFFHDLGASGRLIALIFLVAWALATIPFLLRRDRSPQG